MNNEKLTVERVISGYLDLRAQKETINEEVKERLAVISSAMSKLEAWIQQQSDATGVKSFKTDAGTAFMTTTDFASVADWDEVLAWVIEHSAFDMLTHGVNKNAVREYIALNNTVPNGVNFGTRIGVSVRRPRAKI